jgi:hypothetical protein
VYRENAIAVVRAQRTRRAHNRDNDSDRRHYEVDSRLSSAFPRMAGSTLHLRKFLIDLRQHLDGTQTSVPTRGR